MSIGSGVPIVSEDQGLRDLAIKRTGQLLSLILGMTQKRGGIYIEWMKDRIRYLQDELTFDPTTQSVRRDRGEIVWVNFGFNVGSEEGGAHPALVLQKAPLGAKSVVVAPITSEFNKDGTPRNRRPGDVSIGQVPPLPNKSVVMLGQIRAISKLRMIKGDTGRLPTQLMKVVEKELISFLTGP